MIKTIWKYKKIKKIKIFELNREEWAICFLFWTVFNYILNKKIFYTVFYSYFDMLIFKIIKIKKIFSN
jgi:hypothetical protein